MQPNIPNSQKVAPQSSLSTLHQFRSTRRTFSIRKTTWLSEISPASLVSGVLTWFWTSNDPQESLRLALTSPLWCVSSDFRSTDLLLLLHLIMIMLNVFLITPFSVYCPLGRVGTTRGHQGRPGIYSHMFSYALAPVLYLVTSCHYIPLSDSAIPFLSSELATK